MLGLGVRELYVFLLKFWIAWWLVGLTFLVAALLLAAIFGWLGMALGLSVFERLPDWPRR